MHDGHQTPITNALKYAKYNTDNKEMKVSGNKNL